MDQPSASARGKQDDAQGHLHLSYTHTHLDTAFQREGRLRGGPLLDSLRPSDGNRPPLSLQPSQRSITPKAGRQPADAVRGADGRASSMHAENDGDSGWWRQGGGEQERSRMSMPTRIRLRTSHSSRAGYRSVAAAADSPR